MRAQADDAEASARVLWLLRTGGPLGLLAVALSLYAPAARRVMNDPGRTAPRDPAPVEPA